ncbi:MAG: hypothetical protein ACFCVF_17230 [Kineosporiaceae bacterium]
MPPGYAADTNQQGRGTEIMSWWRTLASYPPTWLAVVLTGAATVALWWWFTPGFGGALALVGCAVVTLAAWPAAAGVTGTVRRLRRRAAERRDAGTDPVPALRRDLARLPDPRPAQQLAAVLDRSENFTDVLGRRLDAGEMTYARYLTAGQQVVAAVVHNLSEVSLAYESIRTIDPPGVERRLRELEPATGRAAERERHTLSARLDLWRSQRERIDDLLADNEAAMTALATTATAISRTPMGTSAADAEVATAELEGLAERASRYAADGRAPSSGDVGGRLGSGHDSRALGQ